MGSSFGSRFCSVLHLPAPPPPNPPIPEGTARRSDSPLGSSTYSLPSLPFPRKIWRSRPPKHLKHPTAHTFRGCWFRTLTGPSAPCGEGDRRMNHSAHRLPMDVRNIQSHWIFSPTPAAAAPSLLHTNITLNPSNVCRPLRFGISGVHFGGLAPNSQWRQIFAPRKFMMPPLDIRKHPPKCRL